MISINLGQGASSVNASVSGDRRPMGMGGGTTSGGLIKKDEGGDGWVGGGVWEFDPNTKVSNTPVLHHTPA